MEMLKSISPLWPKTSKPSNAKKCNKALSEMTDGEFMFYVIVSDKKIRAGIANERAQTNAWTSDISPNSEYSIVQITRYVNCKDILKYIPDEMPAKERIFGK